MSPPGADARPTLRATFPVHSYEVDAFGILDATALAGYLQEVAGRHAEGLGVGLDLLAARGLTWVLARTRIELPAAPRLGETVEIETWPAGVERLAALRNFVVRREDGSEAARASTQWYVLDLATRRPVRPGEVLDPRLPRAPTPLVAPFTEGKLPALDAWDAERRFQVRYADIDRNLHVTNASYVTWAIEAVPVARWRASRLAALEVQYLAEALHGAPILSRARAAGEDDYAHAIVREDGKELARLATRWTAR